jgi:hypothetical protein
MLPPGRLRLVTSPGAIGSPPIANTMGIVVVAALAANAAGVPLIAAIAATFRRTRSADSDVLALLPGPRHPCPCSLADLLCLDLGQRSQRRQHVADQLVIRGKVIFGVAVEANTTGVHSLQVQVVGTMPSGVFEAAFGAPTAEVSYSRPPRLRTGRFLMGCWL